MSPKSVPRNARQWRYCRPLAMILSLSVALIVSGVSQAQQPATSNQYRSVDDSQKAVYVNTESKLPSNVQQQPHRYPEPSTSNSASPKKDSVQQIASELLSGPDRWTSPEGIGSSLQVMLLLSVLSLAPALLLMTTSFVRVVVVLGILRQALGTQQLPPTQVLTSIAVFVTLLIMTPVWKQTYDEAVSPYMHNQMKLEVAWQKGIQPIRRFMSQQIKHTGNTADVLLFCKYLPEGSREPSTFDEVPLQALLPAFMLSELKTAFLIGFQIYLPFMILDIVVSAVTVSMGMLMLPPALISLPFKLLLFVLADGWHLVAEMLLQSFQPFT